MDFPERGFSGFNSGLALAKPPVHGPETPVGDR